MVDSAASKRYTGTFPTFRDPMMTDVDSWTPLGRLLSDYQAGRVEAEAEVIWEDGGRVALPASVFFRQPDSFDDVEWTAVELCRGRVLDVGAGAGCHALALQERGLEVCAIDVCREAVEVMRARGVREARTGDVFDAPAEGFSTLLLLMNGIGLVGDVAGFGRFLDRAGELLVADGQILLDSADLRQTDDVDELRRLVVRVREGRYRGETRQRIEYRNLRGAAFGWLYLDSETLAAGARQRGWSTDVVFEAGDGAYLARLVKR